MWLVRGFALAVAGVVGAIVLALAVGNVFPAGSNFYTLISSAIWAVAGPYLIILSIIAAVLIVTARMNRKGIVGGFISGIAAAALIGSVGITVIIASTAVFNGGSVNPFTTFNLDSASEPDAVETYLTVDGEELTAQIYEPPGGVDGAPVLMYIHGGGWVSGSAQEFGAIARAWADLGWFAVSVNYRLATPDSPTWDKAPADVGCALTWTVDKARDAGANVDELVVAGDSAGGNLAMLLGWSDEPATSCPDLGEVPAPNALVVAYPVANPEYTYEFGTDFLGENPQQFTREFLGGAPSDFPKRLAAISPETFVRAGLPSTLIVQPDRDEFIPAQGNREVADSAIAAGAPVEVVGVPFTNHGFDIIPTSVGGQVKLSVASAWLAGLGLTAKQ